MSGFLEKEIECSIGNGRDMPFLSTLLWLNNCILQSYICMLVQLKTFGTRSRVACLSPTENLVKAFCRVGDWGTTASSTKALSFIRALITYPMTFYALLFCYAKFPIFKMGGKLLPIISGPQLNPGQLSYHTVSRLFGPLLFRRFDYFDSYPKRLMVPRFQGLAVPRWGSRGQVDMGKYRSAGDLKFGSVSDCVDGIIEK